MRFGVREICEVTLRAKSFQKLGNRKFYKNEPVLYFETLKTSSLEGAATTVYATGGRGNTRLIAWEGERTMTFVMEDALLSMESFSILSGAGLIDATANKPIYVHQTSQVQVGYAVDGSDIGDNKIAIPALACWNGLTDKADPQYHASADIFVMVLKNGEVAEEPCIPAAIEHTATDTIITCYSHAGTLPKDSVVLVDYYVKKVAGAQMMEITPDKFGGNYYLEASTLFRRESDGVDMPAEFIIPNCKVQSNFTFSMASTGDPSTFTFTLDAFPDYTKFDPTKKVLAAIQIVSDETLDEEDFRQPCAEGVVNFNQTASSDAVGATVQITSNSDTACAISVTGNSVVENASANASFNSEGQLDGVNAMVLNFSIPIPEDGECTIVQTNPALVYYADDEDVALVGSNYVKTKTYAGLQAPSETLSIILTEDSTAVKVEIMHDGAVVKTYNITANITFA